jgi:rhamnosyltransferase
VPGEAATGTHAVIVTFSPDGERFERQAATLARQVAKAVVVDNGSTPQALARLRATCAARADHITLIELGENRGIAAAQNVGIGRALTAGAERILLMDHDSLPDDRMVARLEAALAALRATGLKVAAVGPRYLDARQDNPPPFIRVRGGRLHRLPCPSAETVNEVDYLIASGSLIPREALEAVGMMNEALFIDYVDIEWGLRARGRGFLSYGVCGATMSHDLGEQPIVVLGRALPSHSPMRHYYHFRNAAWLFRFGDVPREWKFVDCYRLGLRFGFYAIFAKPRPAHVRAMITGLRDGLRGRLGPAAGPRFATASLRPPGLEP